MMLMLNFYLCIEMSGTCNKNELFLPAIEEKQKALAKFDCERLGIHQLELPIGSYSYTFVDQSSTRCSRELSVYGKRVTLSFQYEVQFTLKIASPS